MRPPIHLTPDEIDRWWSATLAVDEIAAVAEHADICPRCRDALAASHPPEAVADALQRLLASDEDDDWHLSPDDLCRWVDGQAGDADREAIGAHLALCRRCRADADDLAAFAAPPKAGWRRQSLTWLSAAAVLSIAALGGWLWSRHAAPPPVTARSVVGPQRTEAVAALHDGPLTVTADGTIHGVPPEWRSIARETIRSPRLVPPAVAAAVVTLPERQRSESATPPLIRIEDPVSRVVLSDRPTFEWTAATKAPVRIDVYDERFERVTSSGPLRASSWTPATPLPRGRRLSWTVTPLGRRPAVSFPVPPAPPAVFLITPNERADEIVRARATGSHLLAGIALWRGGLLGDAAVEFAILARENRESPIARALAESSRRALPSGVATGRSR